MDMINFDGLLIGIATFLIIGLFLFLDDKGSFRAGRARLERLVSKES